MRHKNCQFDKRKHNDYGQVSYAPSSHTATAYPNSTCSIDCMGAYSRNITLKAYESQCLFISIIIMVNKKSMVHSITTNTIQKKKVSLQNKIYIHL